MTPDAARALADKLQDCVDLSPPDPATGIQRMIMDDSGVQMLQAFAAQVRREAIEEAFHAKTNMTDDDGRIRSTEFLLGVAAKEIAIRALLDAPEPAAPEQYRLRERIAKSGAEQVTATWAEGAALVPREVLAAEVNALLDAHEDHEMVCEDQPTFPEALTRTARALWDAWRGWLPPPTDEQGNVIDNSWELMPEEFQACYRNMARRAAEELGMTIDD